MRGIAFCPAHITGFFKAELGNHNQNYCQIGSVGAGFSIQHGVKTIVDVIPSNEFGFSITNNGYFAENNVISEYIIRTFFDYCKSKYFVKVKHEINVPVGYGLGSSGAVALSLSMALNEALNLKLTSQKIAEIAHKAEVICKTGLGDVIGSYYGGFEIRIKSGSPGVGKLEKIYSDLNVILVCFAPISTKKFISEKIDSINGLGGRMVNELLKTKNFNDFQDMSIRFSRFIQFMTPRMEKLVNEFHKNKIKCGVALFGETVFTLIESKQEKKVLEILKNYPNSIIIKSKIDNDGVRLIN